MSAHVDLTRIGPDDVRPDRDFQKFLREGRLMLQRSRDTGRHVFYPRVAEPVTGSLDLEWVAASGRGRVYSTTVVRQKPPSPDYNVAIIELDEGPRLMSRVDGVAPTEVCIGMPVRAKIVDQEGVWLVVFEPA